MKNISKITEISSAAILIAFVAVVLSASAQDALPKLTTSSKGEVHFNKPVKVGNTVLNPGMYEVQHVVEGTDHAIAFKQIQMPAGYRHSNITVAQEPAARVTCDFQPVANKVRNTKVTLRTNAAGEKEIAELQIVGEPFKHLFTQIGRASCRERV